MMRLRFFVALLVWVWSAAAWAAPAFVQSNSNSASSGTTVAVAYSSNLTAGNLITVCINANKGVTSLTDSLGHTYTAATLLTDGSTYAMGLYYVPNITGGANTVTLTLNGAVTYAHAEIHEYSGVATTSPLDQTTGQFQAAPGTGANAVTSGNVTTTTDGQLIFGCTNSLTYGASTVSAGTSFTKRQEVFSDSPSEDRVQPSAGLVAATYTTTAAATNYFTLVGTFKAQAAASCKGALMLLGAGGC